MINYAFTIAKFDGSREAAVELVVTQTVKLSLRYFSVQCWLAMPAPPDDRADYPCIASLQTSQISPSALGQAASLTPIAPAVVMVNFGWPNCTDKVPYEGNWDIPQRGKLELRLAWLDIPGVAPLTPPFEINWQVKMQFLEGGDL